MKKLVIQNGLPILKPPLVVNPIEEILKLMEIL